MGQLNLLRTLIKKKCNYQITMSWEIWVLPLRGEELILKEHFVLMIVTIDNNAFNNFINVNLLQDFTDGYDENNTYNVKKLASSETFEEYVKESAKVINARSKRMWKELQTK